MAHRDSHHSSRHGHRHRHKHKHHNEGNNYYVPESHNEGYVENTQEEVTHTYDTYEENVPLDSAWSVPYLDPQSGRFSYQCRQTPDGQMEYQISGSHSGVYPHEPIPAAQALTTMSAGMPAMPYLAGNLMYRSYPQYAHSYAYPQPSPQPEAQRYPSNRVVEFEDARPGAQQDGIATRTKAPARDSAASHRHRKKDHGDRSTHHRGRHRY